MSFFSHHKPNIVADIHATDIRIAEIKNGTITRTQSIPLPDGAFVKDRIAGPEIISETFSRAIADFAKGTKDIIMIAPDIHCFIHVFEIPDGLDDEARRKEILDQASHSIPVDQTDVYWDYYQQGKNPETGNNRVVYVGVLREIVDHYVSFAEQAGCSLSGIHPETLVLSEMLLAKLPPREPSGATMIVTTGDATASLSLFDEKHEFLVSSIVPFISGRFTRSIVQSIHSLENDQGKQPTLDPQTIGTDQETVLQTALHIITDEIIKAKSFAQERFQKNLGHVILSGELAQLPKSDQYFSSVLEIPVSLGTVSGDQGNIFLSCTGVAQLVEQPDHHVWIMHFLPPQKKKELFHAKESTVKPSPVVSEQKPTPRRGIIKKIMGVLFLLATFAILGYVVYHYILVPIRQ